MVKFEVYVRGLIVGAVCGKNRLDANIKAMKYFPDCTSVSIYLSNPDMVWVSENFALFNRSYQ
jgi:hypothetical protein